MSTQTAFTVPSDYDGLRLSVLMLLPEGEPVAAVQLVHGICEFKERYLPFMEYLCARGCAVIIHDHRGHGASKRSEEDFGYAGEGLEEAVLRDVHLVTRIMKEQYPKLPFYLLGHSMGSLAVRAYLQKHDTEIDKLVVCGSPGENSAAGFGLVLIALSERIHGERYRDRFLWSLINGSWKKRFGKNRELYPEGGELSEDCVFTLNGDRTLLRLMKRAYHITGRRSENLPVLFISGGCDHYAPDRRGFEAAVEKLRGAGYKNVRSRVFDPLHHDILTTDGCDEVYRTVGEFFGVE